MDKITANMGVGFMINDALTVGIAKATHDGHDLDGEKTLMTYGLVITFQ